MATKLPNSNSKKFASTPKARVAVSRKSAQLRGFSPFSLGQCWPGHWPGQPGPCVREPGPNQLGTNQPRPGGALGLPLNIAEVADLIGCSSWTVRQTLIPRGLPHFRSAASGRLIFYEAQIVRWIENQQQGGKTTK